MDLDPHQTPEDCTFYYERYVGYCMPTLHRNMYPIQHSAGNPNSKWSLWVCETELLHACTCVPDQRVGWLLLDATPTRRTFVIGTPAFKTGLICYMQYVACLKYEQGQKKRPRTPQT